MPAQFVAILSHGHWMKVLEAYIAALKISEKVVWVEIIGARGIMLRSA